MENSQDPLLENRYLIRVNSSQQVYVVRYDERPGRNQILLGNLSYLATFEPETA